MIDKVWAIKGREEKIASNQNRYLQVTVAGDDGKDHKYNIYEQGMWAVFQSNDYVAVKLEKPEGEGKRWEVRSASSVADNLPPPQTPAPLPTEAQAIVDKAIPEPPPIKERNPQEIGLAYKILSELYVNGFIDENKADGKELVLRLKMWLKEVLLGR